MSKKYDVIVIGAGHNGLVAAAYLAKSGKKVLILERRDILGGAAATEEIFPGFRINTGAIDAGLFRPEIVAQLGLQQYGLEFIESPVTAVGLQPDGPALALWRDPRQTLASLSPFSSADAEKFPAFISLVTTITGLLDNMMTLTPPNLEETGPGDILRWLRVGLKLRGLGPQAMMEFLRILPMSVAEFLDEWFENRLLKGLLGSSGVIGTMQGPQASGTAFMLLYHCLGVSSTGFRATRFVRGGIGELSAVLSQVAKAYKAEIRTGAGVSQILLDENPDTGMQRACGVVLAGGEEIQASAVISNVDPRRTFFDLAGASQLDPHFVRRIKNIRYRGCTAKVNLALSELPHFNHLPVVAEGQREKEYLGGHIIICPDLEYLERAYDEAKYGHFSTQPYLDVVIPSVLDPSLAPEGQHVMSITMQYAPYKLGEGNWPEQSHSLAETIINTLAQYAPNLKDVIRDCQILTPLDWEQAYGLTEGCIFHGQMSLDQLLYMRPVPGYAQYRTPIDRLYLCGAGAHPGGGLTGAPGYNAAREILSDLKRVAP